MSSRMSNRLRRKVRMAARASYSNLNVQIVDDAKVTVQGKEGFWVEARVYVRRHEVDHEADQVEHGGES